jgi:hypothetical protein
MIKNMFLVNRLFTLELLLLQIGSNYAATKQANIFTYGLIINNWLQRRIIIIIVHRRIFTVFNEEDSCRNLPSFRRNIIMTTQSVLR